MMNTLIIAGDDKWSVANLCSFLHAMNILYNRLYVFRPYLKFGYKSLATALDNSLSYVPHEEQLFIDKMSMKSPAEFTFKGSGEVLREMRELIKDISFRNRIEKEQMLADLRKKQIENMILNVKMMEECGYSQEQIKDIIGKFIPSIQTLQTQIERYDLFTIEKGGGEESEENQK